MTATGIEPSQAVCRQAANEHRKKRRTSGDDHAVLEREIPFLGHDAGEVHQRRTLWNPDWWVAQVFAGQFHRRTNHPEDREEAEGQDDQKDGIAQRRPRSAPGIARVIAVAILFRALDAFKVFDLVYMFTQGGPGTSTESISWYIYQLGFKFFRLGYASAASFVVVIIMTIIATLYVARFVRGADA